VDLDNNLAKVVKAELMVMDIQAAEDILVTAHLVLQAVAVVLVAPVVVLMTPAAVVEKELEDILISAVQTPTTQRAEAELVTTADLTEVDQGLDMVEGAPAAQVMAAAVRVVHKASLS
jgi:hypothetical protein